MHTEFGNFSCTTEWAGLTEETKEDLEELRDSLEDQLDVVDMKLAFLKITKSDVFDPLTFKVWGALQTLDNDVDRAKVIAGIINSEYV
jgi:hypothetical protein